MTWVILPGFAFFLGATAYDLEWAWLLARVPSSILLETLGGTLLESGRPGIPDAVLLIYLLAAAAFLAALAPGAPRFLKTIRAAALRPVVAGFLTLALAQVLRVVFARSGPADVLGGVLAFAPWWPPGGFATGFSNPWWQGGSFPALSSTLAGFFIALACRIPGRYGEVRRLAVTMAVMAGGGLGLLEVYAQHHWPTDVLAGLGLGALAGLWPRGARQ